MNGMLEDLIRSRIAAEENHYRRDDKVVWASDGLVDERLNGMSNVELLKYISDAINDSLLSYE